MAFKKPSSAVPKYGGLPARHLPPPTAVCQPWPNPPPRGRSLQYHGSSSILAAHRATRYCKSLRAKENKFPPPMLRHRSRFHQRWGHTLHFGGNQISTLDMLIEDHCSARLQQFPQCGSRLLGVGNGAEDLDAEDGVERFLVDAVSAQGVDILNAARHNGVDIA